MIAPGLRDDERDNTYRVVSLCVYQFSKGLCSWDVNRCRYSPQISADMEYDPADGRDFRKSIVDVCIERMWAEDV